MEIIALDFHFAVECSLKHAMVTGEYIYHIHAGDGLVTGHINIYLNILFTIIGISILTKPINNTKKNPGTFR